MDSKEQKGPGESRDESRRTAGGRLCESDHPECSGLNPCPKCYLRVIVQVLPPAMRAAGFANEKERAQAFFKTYAEAWKKMLIEKASAGQDQYKPPAASGWLNTWNEIHKTIDIPYSAPLNGKKGTKLERGELRRMAEKQAKESLVPTSVGITTNKQDTQGGADSSKSGEEKH